jgi:hypothetical protein
MEEIDAESLEGALQNMPPTTQVPATQNQAPALPVPQAPQEVAPSPGQPAVPAQPKMSPDEEVGFHKGSINTLVSERNELVKMIGNVEAIMNAHLSRLKELGIDIKDK